MDAVLHGEVGDTFAPRIRPAFAVPGVPCRIHVGVEGPDHTYGYGMLNAANAYSYLITRYTPSQLDTDGIDTGVDRWGA